MQLTIFGVHFSQSNFYQLPVLFKPFLDGRAMMDSQIVQNQKDLSSGSPDQRLHECDQKIAIHRFAIEDETDLPTIGNCRNYADTALLRTEGSNRSDSLGRVTTLSIRSSLNAGLIAPVDLGVSSLARLLISGYVSSSTAS